MKLAVFGAGGRIGQRIVKEAASRGHDVVAIVRDPSKVTLDRDHVQVRKGTAADTKSVVGSVAGCEAVVSAIGPSGDDTQPAVLIQAAACLMDALPRTGVKRLVVVGGAGSLEVSPGQQLVDSPDFPEAAKPVALAHRQALQVYRAWRTPVNWTYISPAGAIEPGERTGAYRRGDDQLLTDANGVSRISMEDYAVAVVDELEKPQAHQRRITVAY